MLLPTCDNVTRERSMISGVQGLWYYLNLSTFFIYINSILAVIYLTKLQNLINRPVYILVIFPTISTTTSSTMVRNINTRNPPFHIRSYRKVHTFRESMNRLLNKSKNQYPVDLFNSYVARLRSANTHLFDERSSEGHD